MSKIHENNVHQVSDNDEVGTYKHMRTMEFNILCRDKFGNDPDLFKANIEKFNSLKSVKEVENLFLKIEELKNYNEK